MRPARRTARAGSAQGGFTLIEVLAVLAILAGAAFLAMPVTRGAVSGQALRSAASDVAAAARMTRAAAVRSGREQALTIDIGARRYWADGVFGPRTLPGRIGLEITVPNGEQTDASTTRIRFLPGGGSSGGKLVLSAGTSSAIVNIDWLTGGANVATP